MKGKGQNAGGATKISPPTSSFFSAPLAPSPFIEGRKK